MGARILLVEGRADTEFYTAWCSKSGRKVDTKPPTAVGATIDSKTNALFMLPEILKQLRDGSVERLGVVVDADYKLEHGLGFDGSFKKVKDALVEGGFGHPTTVPRSSGFLFPHPDGLSPVGLWIMPDNRREGMLEDFIEASITETHELTDRGQRAIFSLASKAVSEIKTPLFKPIHQAKARSPALALKT